MGKNIKNRNVLTFTLVVMLIFLVVFSEYFIHRELDHECSEDACPICLVLNQSNNILSNLLKNNTISSIVLAIVFYFIKTIDSNQKILTFSLIEKNVRLNE